jgi:UDP-N-acetylmuramate: L-alanyl-gamma-D-glutamyl-meso-diaminopimelate ligase
VGESLTALARRYPGRRRIVLYEPRSLTAGRRMLHGAYRRAFSGAHRVLFAPVFHRRRLGEECLDLDGLAGELTAAGVPASACSSVDQALERALTEARPGDVVVTMSSGSFEDLPRRLLAVLQLR